MIKKKEINMRERCIVQFHMGRFRKKGVTTWRFTPGPYRGNCKKDLIINWLTDPGSRIPVLCFVTRASISLDWPLGRFDRGSRVNDIVLREPLCRGVHHDASLPTILDPASTPPILVPINLISPIPKCRTQRNKLHAQSAFRFHNYQTFMPQCLRRNISNSIYSFM